MLERRLAELGIEYPIEFTHDSEAFQKRIAGDLRRLVFSYLQRKLTNIPDGPAVINLRENLNLIGGMNDFINQQSPNGAWATDIELTLLAELLNVNFVVQFNDGRTTVLRASNEDNQPIFSVRNTNNTHWDAITSTAHANYEKRQTVHNGNCGYNSFAEHIRINIKPKILETKSGANQPQTVVPVNTISAQDSYFKRAIEQYKAEEKTFELAHEKLKNTDIKQYNKVMDQIASDAQLALQLALADLPGVQNTQPARLNGNSIFRPNCKTEFKSELPSLPQVRI